MFELHELSLIPEMLSDDESNLLILDEETENVFSDFMEIEDCSIFTTVARNLSLICPSISHIQGDALLNMLSELKSNPVATLPTQEDWEDFQMPSWEDCHSSICYQLVYKKWRVYISEICNTLNDKIPSPREIFNCRIFFDFMRASKCTGEQAKIINSPVKISILEKPADTNRVQEVNTLGVEPLPIDSHRYEILEKVRRDRVVTVHGETVYIPLMSTAYYNTLHY